MIVVFVAGSVLTALRAFAKLVFLRSTILGSRLINLAKRFVRSRGVCDYNVGLTFAKDLLYVRYVSREGFGNAEAHCARLTRSAASACDGEDIECS